jgi:transposase-like protein
MNTREITRQYRLKQWTELIRECRSSGQTVVAWCAEKSINPKSYYYWLKKVRQAACDSLPACSSSSDQLIVPVSRASQESTLSPSPQAVKNYDLRIHLGSIAVDLSNTASASLIENTLKALQNVR